MPGHPAFILPVRGTALTVPGCVLSRPLRQHTATPEQTAAHAEQQKQPPSGEGAHTYWDRQWGEWNSKAGS